MRVLQTLEALVHDLGVWFEDGPGLIIRLGDPRLRTRQPRDPATTILARHPGSRPPAPLDALHWAEAIKAGVVAMDLALRGSRHTQSWRRALRGLPQNAETAGQWQETHAQVSAYHSAALTCLGLQKPARDVPGVRCLVCGQATIRCRADDDQPRAWCANDDCLEEHTDPRTGAVTWRRPRYSGDRLYQLTATAAVVRRTTGRAADVM